MLANSGIYLLVFIFIDNNSYASTLKLIIGKLGISANNKIKV